jgi:hypothetical protein
MGPLRALSADLLIVALGANRFAWGGSALIDANELRRTYIDAVRAGDQHVLGLLLAFARA